ncbi:MAG: GGDEF domain-containing protein [Bacteriovoracaceae bacterium]|nr:GGDEF domain-containing protein [Bacteriovoracaceae bacterium]
MTRKILLLNFDQRKKRKFEQCLTDLNEEFEVQNINSASELDSIEFKAHSLFYLHDSSVEEFEKNIAQIKRSRRTLPINVIFQKRDFATLLKAFEFSLSMVLDRKYCPEQLQKALIRSDLRNFKDGKLDLPLGHLMELLSSPIKVKTDLDLFQKLSSYFNNFDEGVELSILSYDQRNFDLVAGVEIKERDIYKKIKEFQLPRIFIGQTIEVELSEKTTLCAFPVYRKQEQETWCVCRLDKSQKDFILNDLFFRHLENALIYRKNLEKISGYIDLANKDDVTGLFNQRKLGQDLEKAIESHKEAEKTFSVMFIDVDHFKQVNDNFGHVVGSQMLLEIAEELRRVLRSTDKIYRYGGDEFVVIMPEAPISAVHNIALRVREAVKMKSFNIGEAKNYQLSLSIGIAEYPTDATTATEIINFADSMMYVSKKSGRGKVYHVGEIEKTED